MSANAQKVRGCLFLAPMLHHFNDYCRDKSQNLPWLFSFYSTSKIKDLRQISVVGEFSAPKAFYRSGWRFRGLSRSLSPGDQDLSPEVTSATIAMSCANLPWLRTFLKNRMGKRAAWFILPIFTTEVHLPLLMCLGHLMTFVQIFMCK